MNEMNYGEQKTERVWFDGHRVLELQFLEYFQDLYGYKWINGCFYDRDGNPKTDMEMRHAFVLLLDTKGLTNLGRRSRELLDLAKVRWNRTTPPPVDTLIYLQNGVFDTLEWQLKPDKTICPRRLAVKYNPDAPKPELFLAFLSDLLEPEDILTLQEYLGYCLIPTTKAQKMLVLMGKGGEGKSVLGQIIGRIWDNAACFNSIQKIATNPFARADLEDKLLMLDDDMALEALTQTHYIKTLITLSGKTDVERKGIQSYQAQLFARFIGLSNGVPTALYDRSDGFFRRLLLISVKERPKDRINDPYLFEKLEYELEGILLWCLEGLSRLYEKNYIFTISQKTKANIHEAMREADPVGDFLKSNGYICLDPKGSITTSDLYALFKRYCADNVKTPLSDKTFERRVREPLLKAGVIPTTHVPHHQRSIRGYLGIRPAMPMGWTE